MPEKKKEKKKLLTLLKHKFRIVLMHDETFQKVGFIRFSRLNVISVSTGIVVLIIAATWSVVAYTPVRELIPGYPDAELRQDIVHNRLKLDSLKMEIAFRDQYFYNLKSVISGQPTEEFINLQSNSSVEANLQRGRSRQDSLLRSEVSLSEKFNIPVVFEDKKSTRLENLYFFSPVRGMVTNSFNPMNSHFGTDIVAGANEVVKATLDGTVVMVSWTLQTGHVIQIQHDNNLISVYKHNAEILKKVGMRVKAGDAIAIIGNSGEVTTGPHLHFEIWHNGIPLNPEDFIVF